jgi:hypothetical protein
MHIEFYGYDADENEIRTKFGPFKSIQVMDDCVEGVERSNQVVRIAHKVDDGDWGPLPVFTKGNFTPGIFDAPIWSGFNINE